MKNRTWSALCCFCLVVMVSFSLICAVKYITWRTVSDPKNSSSWRTYATCRFIALSCGCPLRVILPDLSFCRPASALSNVVLPDPEGPIIDRS